MPSLNAYIERRFPVNSHQMAVSRGVNAGHGEADYMHRDRLELECAALVNRVVLRNAQHAHAQFIGFSQAEVDSFGRCLTYVPQLLLGAIPNVGQYFSTSSSPYEKCFGKRALGGVSATKRAEVQARTLAAARYQAWPEEPASGYEKRANYVRAKLADLAATATQAWMYVKSTDPGDSASLASINSRLLKIGPAFPRGEKGLFHAGVLIHEMGHNLGLADVCSVCHEAHFAAAQRAHFVDRGNLKCPNSAVNDRHGADGPTTGSGHYNGEARVLLLAKTAKNLTVFNTDSYRWFCYAPHMTTIRQEVAEHLRLKALEPVA